MVMLAFPKPLLCSAIFQNPNETAQEINFNSDKLKRNQNRKQYPLKATRYKILLELKGNKKCLRKVK